MKTSILKWLQIACIVIVSLGIVTELIYGADIGFVFLTVGSMAFAVSTKIERG